MTNRAAIRLTEQDRVRVAHDLFDAMVVLGKGPQVGAGRRHDHRRTDIVSAHIPHDDAQGTIGQRRKSK